MEGVSYYADNSHDFLKMLSIAYIRWKKTIKY